MPTSNAKPAIPSEATTRLAHEVAETRTSRGRTKRETTGRYDGQRVPQLASGVGRPIPSLNVRTAVAAVVDPWGNGLGRIQATVNRNVDILEQERSHHRISEAAYLTGRQIQMAFESLGHLGSTNWQGGDRKDAKTVSDVIAVNSLDAARVITDLMQDMAARVGMRDTRLIRTILGERQSFAQCAVAEGKSPDKHGSQYIGTRFRDALEDLAEAWAAKGKRQNGPADKHDEAASGAADRQRTSMATGVTAARRVEEQQQEREEARRRAEAYRKANTARRA